MNVNSNFSIRSFPSGDENRQVFLDQRLAEFFLSYQNRNTLLDKSIRKLQEGQSTGLSHRTKSHALRDFVVYVSDLLNQQSPNDHRWAKFGKIHVKHLNSQLEKLSGEIESLLEILQTSGSTDFVREQDDLRSILGRAQVARKGIDASRLPFYIPKEFKEWALTSVVWTKMLPGHLPAETLRKTELIVMRAFQKIAQFSVADAIRLELPSTPLRIMQVNSEIGYHRMGESELVLLVDKDLNNHFQMPMWNALAMSSPLFEECLARVSRNLNVPHQPRTLEELKNCLDAISVISTSTHAAPIDLTMLFPPSSGDTKEWMSREAVEEAFNAILNVWEVFEERLEKRVCFYLWGREKSLPILLIPDLYNDPDVTEAMKKSINDLRAVTGFCVSPDQAYDLELDVHSLNHLLGPHTKLNVADVSETGEIERIPAYRDFCKKAQLKCYALNEASNEPYVKIFAEGTLGLLQGFEKLNIDQKFSDLNLSDLLQHSYARILKALDDAQQCLDQLPAFIGAMEIVHHEIQNILMIVEPYGAEDFAVGELASLKPLLPEDLTPSVIQVKPSGMRCLSSLIASVEAQNEGRSISMLLQEDVYYETLNLPEYFGQKCITFDPKKSKIPKSSVNLFLCEIHHNASDEIHTYRAENVLHQIHHLDRKEVFTQQFTVGIDITICSTTDMELQKIVSDDLVKKRIAEGRLNLVLLRSAQKFDMLGFDNYYGGVVTAFNNPDHFAAFNRRLADPKDQLQGLSYQGLTHLILHAAPQIEAYRLSLMERTTKLYQLMPKELKQDPSPYPLYAIAKRRDQNGVFIAFKNGNAAAKQLRNAALGGRIHLMDRSSFGFPLPSISLLHKGLRLCPGLETDAGLKAIAQIFIDLVEGKPMHPLLIK